MEREKENEMRRAGKMSTQTAPRRCKTSDSRRFIGQFCAVGQSRRGTFCLFEWAKWRVEYFIQMYFRPKTLVIFVGKFWLVWSSRSFLRSDGQKEVERRR